MWRVPVSTAWVATTTKRGIVARIGFDALLDDLHAVDVGRFATGDGGIREIARGLDFLDGAGRVLHRMQPPVSMALQKLATLLKSLGRAQHPLDGFETGAGLADEMMDDSQGNFAHHLQVVFQQQIVVFVDAAHQRVFQRQDAVVHVTGLDAFEDIAKRGIGNRGHLFIEVLGTGFVAEGAGFAQIGRPLLALGP